MFFCDLEIRLRAKMNYSRIHIEAEKFELERLFTTEESHGNFFRMCIYILEEL